jgi:hypothetical protein
VTIESAACDDRAVAPRREAPYGAGTARHRAPRFRAGAPAGCRTGSFPARRSITAMGRRQRVLIEQPDAHRARLNSPTRGCPTDSGLGPLP